MHFLKQNEEKNNNTLWTDLQWEQWQRYWPSQEQTNTHSWTSLWLRCSNLLFFTHKKHSLLHMMYSDQEHPRPGEPVREHPEGLRRRFLQWDGPQLRGWPPWCRARFVFFIFTFMYKVTIMIYLYSYFSGEASGSVCGMGGVKRKRADSGHLMEVDHIHHPGPQRPSKKWWPKILWFCYSKHLAGVMIPWLSCNSTCCGFPCNFILVCGPKRFISDLRMIGTTLVTLQKM